MASPNTLSARLVRGFVGSGGATAAIVSFLSVCGSNFVYLGRL